MAFPGAGIAKGMATTFRNFFAPKVTRQYPEVRPEIPDRWRGRLDLIYDPSASTSARSVSSARRCAPWRPST